MRRDQLEVLLMNKIPLARALGIRVAQADAKCARVTAPLDPNVNHMGTAFGGSINAVLVLACYSWLFNALDEHGLASHVVLKNSSVQYLKPVTGDFTATCSAPTAVDVERFFAVMKRRGRAQVDLKAVIDGQGGPLCEFQGVFVAIPDQVGRPRIGTADPR